MERGLRVGPPRRERARPEDLADHGCVLQQSLLRRREPVEARGDDAPAASRAVEASAVGRAPVELGELLGVERVAAGALRARPAATSASSTRHDRAAAAGGRAVCRRDSGAERERERVELAAAPARPAVEQLRPGGPTTSSGTSSPSRRGRRRSRAGPRPPSGDPRTRGRAGRCSASRLEEPPPGRERLVRARSLRPPPRGRRAGRSVACRSSSASSSSGTSVSTPRGASRSARRRVVGLEDPGLRLHDLAERPEAHAARRTARRTALAPGDELGVGLDDLEQLVDEAALADPRDADERDELGRRSVRARRTRREERRARARVRRAGCAASARRRRRSATRARDASHTATGSALPFAVDRPALRGSRSRRGSRGTSSRRRGCR